jgi:hypothetical protein
MKLVIVVQINNMITERHNMHSNIANKGHDHRKTQLACRMIFKAIRKTGGFVGSCIVSKDIGSNERMTMQKSPDS